MKKILFLLLFPAFAFAQYPGNANQKITLGEQTTADGLIFRGVASTDTVAATSKITRSNKQDTSAYILLDTTTSIMWQYRIPNNAWTRLGGSISSGLTGTLPVANGGTGSSTQNFVDLSTTQTVNGAKTFGSAATFSSSVTGTAFIPSGSSVPTNGLYLPMTNTIAFSTNSSARMRLDASGNLGLGVTPANWATITPLQVINASFSGYSNEAHMNANYYYNAGGKYIASDYATRYIQTSGQHIWFNAPSGTAGNAITFTEAMTLNSNNELQIGYTTDQGAYRLQVQDSVYVGGNVSASAYTTRSDYDLKDEIQNITYGINEVMQMQPVKYTYKSNGSTQLGFIAQDLGVITPEVVSFEDKMSVYYNALIPILTKAIQEQQTLIKALEQRIINLENK